MIRTTPIAPFRADAPGGHTIYYIRHGETDWNRAGRLQGSRDIPLNDLGRKQAAEVARHLRDVAGAALDKLPWIVSPMDRAQETARICRRQLGLAEHTYRVDQRLSEISFGQWEGLTWKEVKRADPSRAAGRSADKWGYVPPGGESYAVLRDRVRPVFEAITTDTVVVAHGGIARTQLVELAAMGEAEATIVDIWQGRVMVLRDGGAFWAP